MKHLFVSYEIAKQLKDKGFNGQCFCYWYLGDTGNNVDHFVYEGSFMDYNTSDLSISVPLYQQIVDWFRDKHGLSLQMSFDSFEDKEWDCVVMGLDGTFNGSSLCFNKDYYKGLNELIEHALTLI